MNLEDALELQWWKDDAQRVNDMANHVRKHKLCLDDDPPAASPSELEDITHKVTENDLVEDGEIQNSNPEGHNQYTKGGSKPLLVDDGSHRIQAAQLEGATHILVHVHSPKIRGLGDKSGTKVTKVAVEDLHPSSQLKNQDEAVKASYDQKAIAKYRKQYREKGEEGWSALPLVQDPNLKKGHIFK